MKKRINNIKNIHLRAIGVVAISIVVSTMLIGSVLTYYLKKKAVETLDSLHIKSSSLKINLFTRSVTITNLEWPSTPGSLSTKVKPYLFLKNITLKGIGILPYFLQKKIDIREVILENGSALYVKSLQPPRAKKELKLNGFYVNHVTVNNLSLTVFSDTIKEVSVTINTYQGSVNVEKIEGTVDSLNYKVKTSSALLSKVSFGKKKDLYSVNVNGIDYNGAKQKMILDSINLIPNYGKYEFANHLGRQETRVDATIPRVILEGFNLNSVFDSSFIASKIEIQSARIKAFRDKRLPFKNKRIALPMESLKKLDTDIEIDSILIKDMQVAVEEVAIDGTEPGSVTFENIDGVFINLANRYYVNKPRFATLSASALLMGKGRVDATFQFPLDGTRTYHAKGKIVDMPLRQINPILENLGHISIESGQLNEMSFMFDYDDIKSSGELQINYEDLKMTGLNRDSESTKNEFKTFLINTIIKNNKNQNTDKSKRTGKIEFERDQHKFIFNFWWKSVLSGIKSAVLGDRVIEQVENLKKK